MNVTAVGQIMQISVSWDEVPPIDQNGPITSYEVLYQTTLNGISETVTVSGTELSTTLRELEELTSYNISVRANTSAGAGPYSEKMEEQTLQNRRKTCSSAADIH